MCSLVLVIKEFTVLQKKSHQVRKYPQNGVGDICARTSLLEGEGALHHILGAGKGTEQRVQWGKNFSGVV